MISMKLNKESDKSILFGSFFSYKESALTFLMKLKTTFLYFYDKKLLSFCRFLRFSASLMNFRKKNNE